MKRETPNVPRSLSASLVSLFETSQAIAADALTAANAAEARAYASAAQAMQMQARKERARIGSNVLRFAHRVTR